MARPIGQIIKEIMAGYEAGFSLFDGPMTDLTQELLSEDRIDELAVVVAMHEEPKPTGNI